MKRNPKLAAYLTFALTTAAAASTALAGPFANPQLDQAYDQLQAAAVNLALVQNQYQQNGDWANAAARAPILALVNNTLGQLVVNEAWLNGASIPASLVNSVNGQANLATYYAISDVLSPFQSNGEMPNPTQDAANGLTQFNNAMNEAGPPDPGDGGGDDGGGDDGGYGGGDDGGGGDGGGGDGGGDGDPDDDHC